MFGDFFRAFSDLFTERKSRFEVSGLLLTMALLPVSELVVTRMFSHLVISGSARYQADPHGVILSGSIFFLAFAASRALHHLVRLNRVRIFRRGFDSSGEKRPPSKEAWSWAAAFELSTAMVSLIQIAAFCILFTVVDVTFGLINILVGVGVLTLIATIYGRQLSHQVAYLLEGNKPGATGVGERVGKRIRDAELGAIVASLAMALSLAAVLLGSVRGGIAAADALVLFIGLRMMYSQVGNLSMSAMRFARVKARLTAGKSIVDVADPEDEFDEPDEDLGDVGDLKPAKPSAHRTQLVSQMVLAGQRGDEDLVQRISERLSVNVVPLEQEIAAQQTAEAFADLAHGDDTLAALSLMWWPRPFPGSVGNWLSPAILRAASGRPVLFQTPASAAHGPHLVMIGSIAGSAHEHSIVVGTGALNADVDLDRSASYLSVRGPLTADLVTKAGAASPAWLGDPTLLAARYLPVEPGATSGRLAFVRHVSHGEIPVDLSEGMDEVSPLASRPADLEAFIGKLASYDGVVTSDVSTTVICHSYGIPVAPITFEGHDNLRFVYRDYALGAGLSDDLVPLVVDPHLGKVTWGDVLAKTTVADSTLDDIQAAVDRGIASYLERAELT